MHIPDGFLDTKTWVTTAVASTAIIAYAVNKVNEEYEEKDAPLMGVIAAFVFAAQMINFPIAGGTCGHFMGSALSMILLGPWKAILVLFSVLTVQAVLFGDGGITTLGANTLNMAISGPFIAYIVYKRLKHKNLMIAAFSAAFISVFFTSLLTAIDLGLSGTAPFAVAIPIMSGWHTLIGICEGIITAATLAFLLKVRPDLVTQNAALGRQGALVITMIAAAVIAIFTPFASKLPDGLERVAVNAGFINNDKPFMETLMPDNFVPGAINDTFATIVAGLIGIAVLLTIAYSIGILIKRRSREA